MSFLSSVPGISTLLIASRDVHLLLLQRAFRLYAYGSSTLVLALLFNVLGFSDVRIGAFMTLTLLGDVLISLLLTLVADKLGRKRVLLMGCLMMLGSGIVFSFTSNYYILLLAAIVGVISPSGNEIGPFRSIEDSVMAQLTPSDSRADVFALSGLIGSASAALGHASSGWITQRLQTSYLWAPVDSYRIIFIIYALCAVAKLGFTLRLSDACEAEDFIKARQPAMEGTSEAEVEIALLEGMDSLEEPDTPIVKPNKAGNMLTRMLPPLSSESQATVTKLCLLFALDNLASGLVPLSFVVYFFSQKFQLGTGSLGPIFFTTSLISGLSNLVAASLSRSIGLIKTMVFTHLPSAIFLSLVPLPSSVYLAVAFLIARFCTSTMDVAPRTAFLAQVVLKEERTAVMGIVNVVKTLSQSVGPSITGALSERGMFWASFLAAGAMKASYDLGMLYMFMNMRPTDRVGS